MLETAIVVYRSIGICVGSYMLLKLFLAYYVYTKRYLTQAEITIDDIHVYGGYGLQDGNLNNLSSIIVKSFVVYSVFAALSIYGWPYWMYRYFTRWMRKRRFKNTGV